MPEKDSVKSKNPRRRQSASIDTSYGHLQPQTLEIESGVGCPND